MPPLCNLPKLPTAPTAPTTAPPLQPQDIYSLGVLLWELYHGSPPWRALRRPTPPTTCEREHALALEMEAAREEYKRRVARARANASRSGPLMGAASGCYAGPPDKDRDRDAKTRSRDLPAVPPAKAPRPVEDGVWDDPQYRRRACDYLHVAPHCPPQYGRLIRRCLSADPARRPTAVHVMRVLLKMHRRLEAQAAGAGAGAGAGAAPSSQEGAVPAVVSGPPTGVIMALPRHRLHGEPGAADAKQSAAVLAELMGASAATNVTHGGNAANAAAAAASVAAAAAVAPSAAASVAAAAAASERLAGFLVMEPRRSGPHKPPGMGEGPGGGGGGEGSETPRVSAHHVSRPNLLGTAGSVAVAVGAVTASRGSAGRMEGSGWEAQEEEVGPGEAGVQQPEAAAGAAAGAGGSPPRLQGGGRRPSW